MVGYTRQDLEVWMEVMKRALASCGLTNEDIIQVSYGYGLFTGGLGAHYGAEALGATVVPTSGGNTQRQIMLMRDFGTTAVCCTPSYFYHMTEKAMENGIDMRKLPIRAGVFGAEPWTEEMRKRIEDAAGIKAYDIYGLSEIIGRAWRSSAAARKGCTFSRIIFIRRSSIRRRARFCRTGSSGNSCSRRCRSTPCR